MTFTRPDKIQSVMTGNISSYTLNSLLRCSIKHSTLMHFTGHSNPQLKTRENTTSNIVQPPSLQFVVDLLYNKFWLQHIHNKSKIMEFGPIHTSPLCYSPDSVDAVKCVTNICETTKVKLRRVELFMKLHLRATGCHLPLGLYTVTCHPTQVNTPRLNPSQTELYSIYLPQRDGRLS